MFVNLVLSRHREVHAYMYVQYVCTHTRCKLQCTCTSYMYFRWGRVVRDHIASGSRPYRVVRHRIARGHGGYAKRACIYNSAPSTLPFSFLTLPTPNRGV